MLENMIAFIKVIDNQGFNKAARDLGISTPVITRRINELENELGVKLIQRSTRKLAITDAGQLFYNRCKDIIYSVNNAKAAVRSLQEEICGTVKIGIPASLNQLYLIPALPKLLKQYPQLQIETVQGNHLLNLLDKGFDFILHCGELPDSSYYYRKLGKWTKVTCASPSYLAQHNKPNIPRELTTHNCLDHAENHSHTWHYLVDGKLKPYLVNGNVKANNSVDLKNLAIAGLGLAYLPSFTIWPELGNKQLLSVLDEFIPEPLGMYIVYPCTKFMSNKTKVVITFLEEMMKPFFSCGYGLKK